MKKNMSNALFATALLASSSVESNNSTSADLNLDQTKNQVSSLVSDNLNESLYNNLINIHSIESQTDSIEKLSETNLFPTQINTIWLERMSDALLWNIQRWWLDVVHPPFVDYWWFEQVYCAWTIKGFLASLKNPNDRTNSENAYINKEWVDAWMLPDELREAWLYYQYHNMMNYFDYEKVGQNDIINDREWYMDSLLETGTHLKNNWVPWSILFIYFNLSSYKHTVKNYNDRKLTFEPNAQPSINTHQAVFLWNEFMEFDANDVSNVVNWNELEMTEEVDSVNYLTNFIQQRWWYRSSLSNMTKNTIIENFNYFHNIIDFEVNWEKIDLYSELQKPESERIQISPDDQIKISWPVLMDWFHDSNSDNAYISENNHLRTMFYFEFVTIGTYSPSELLLPNDNLRERHWWEWKYDYLTNELDITNLYYLKKDESLTMKLKEAILKYEFWMFDELKFDEYEVELMNQVENFPKWSRERASYNFDLINYREQRINSLVESLDASQLWQFYWEYQNQIKGLQLMWYMQSEWELNPGTVNINSPIPYFNTSNVSDIYSEYIDLKKDEILNTYIQNPNLSTREVELFFFPWDNITTTFNQLQEKLSLYTDQYPNFDKLERLDLLKRLKFVDVIIDRFSNDSWIDLTAWVVPSMTSIDIPLEFINEVLDEILQESFVEPTQTSELDSTIIETISSNREEYDILSHILVHESYERWVPLRKFMKEVWRMLWKTSSYWDFQLRLTNLQNRNNALINLPTAEHIQRAIWHLDNPEIQRIIERRRMRFGEDINNDLQIVEQIREKVKYVEFLSEEQRLQTWEEIYDLFKELFRFNDLRQVNIVWKVVQTSLILDKMHEHFQNLNWWLLASWFNVDNILYDENLQSRYKKLLLVINNRSEKTTLIWTWENYLLRVLEWLGEDINQESYPKLERNWKWGISYNNNVLNQRMDFYLDRLSNIQWDEEVIEELNNSIENLKNSNFSATEYYNLFKNDKINQFLEQNWLDTNMLPTLEEFKNTAFRELFFDYAKNAQWMEPPKNWDTEKKAAWAGWLLTFLWTIFWWKYLLNRRKKKQKI